jgi:large subunit ribosomal protein L2
MLIKAKPTSPGRRGLIKVVHPELHKGGSHKALTVSKKRTSARNNQGRITVRRRGGGHKHHYRIVDFKRDKEGIVGKVERIEYDPNRTAHVALILYADGERRYIIAPKGIVVGSEVLSGVGSPIKPGNCMPLESVPIGATIHCIELKPGKGMYW